MKIKQAFDRASLNYDSLRKQLVPCFDDFYRMIVEILPFAVTENLQVLDLGAGTGILSERILRKYPKTHLTLIDVSDKMLKTARKRLIHFSKKTTFIVGDYIKDLWSENNDRSFDLIISALSIHHLSATKKRKIYQKAYDSFRREGWNF